MIDFFYQTIYIPLYNALVMLTAIAPGGDLGIAIILLTVLVRVILLPLSLKAARTQRVVKKIEPEVAAIKEKYKNNAEEQMRQIMALYKRYGFNPFVNFLFIFIQLPIIFALYFVFFKGGFPAINAELLYPFTPVPESISPYFLGVLDVTGRSILLALLAGVTQFILFRLTFPKPKVLPPNPTFKEEMMRNMSVQMRYVFPLVVVGISYTISAAIALYWTVSNIVSIGQEYYVRWRLDREESSEDKQDHGSAKSKITD